MLSLSALAVSAAIGCSVLTDLSGLSHGVDPDSAGPAADGGGDALAEVGAPEAGHPAGSTAFARRVVLHNLAAVPLPTDHAVCFQLPAAEVATALAAGKMRSDFGDVRVVGPMGERSRVVDQRGEGALAICFRLERAMPVSAVDDGYSITYGSMNLAPPAATEAMVFDFFDGFDGATISNRWLVKGAVAVGGGRLTLPKGTAQPAIATPAASDGVPAMASLEARVRVVNPSSAASGSDFYWWGFQRSGDFNQDVPFSIFYGGMGTITDFHASVAGSCTSVCSHLPLPQTAAFRVYRIDRTADLSRFTFDDGVQRENAGPTGDLSVMFRNFLVDSDIEVDWVRARPLIFPEPDVSVAEERPL